MMRGKLSKKLYKKISLKWETYNFRLKVPTEYPATWLKRDPQKGTSGNLRTVVIKKKIKGPKDFEIEIQDYFYKPFGTTWLFQTTSYNSYYAIYTSWQALHSTKLITKNSSVHGTK